MDLELKIKNFGPIDKATIQVGQFTVFAGPNNTGKTFVAKMLYSILSSRNKDHVRTFFAKVSSTIESNLQLFEQSGGIVVEESPLSSIRKGLQKIDSILRETFPSHPVQNELDRLRAVHPELMAEIQGIRGHFQTLTKPSAIHGNLETSIDILEELFKDVEKAIVKGWQLRCYRNIHGNFQESDLLNFRGDGESPLYFNVQRVGELQLEKGSFAFIPDSQIVQNTFPETFYLESPLYWKLKSVLESIKIDPSSLFEGSLNGVPEYFYDMAVALRRRRIEHPFAEIHTSLYDAIGGRISLSEEGDLEFQQNGKSIPLSLTSAGVANMGMLALLIERGALERGSFLFIDEPESNLHPAWQVEMAKFLFELSRQGVNVVISTHSMTILKWLEVHVKEKPEDRELVRLNKFPPDAEWNDDMDAVMAEIKQSLTKPFSDLYIKGL